jgi:FeS assembly protein IscX
MKWTDAGQVGLALLERHPAVNPLSVRFTDLRQWVLQLEGFDDDPQLSNESRLEAIQMAWYEEWQDRQQPS